MGHTLPVVSAACISCVLTREVPARKEVLGGEAQVSCCPWGWAEAGRAQPGAAGTSWAGTPHCGGAAPACAVPSASAGLCCPPLGLCPAARAPVLPLASSQSLFWTLPPTPFLPEVLSVLGMGSPLLGQLQAVCPWTAGQVKLGYTWGPCPDRSSRRQPRRMKGR